RRRGSLSTERRRTRGRLVRRQGESGRARTQATQACSCWLASAVHNAGRVHSTWDDVGVTQERTRWRDELVTTSRAAGGEASLAASFLIEMLDLQDDVEAVAQELTLVDRDQVVTVFAAEFESSVGPAAFLVYLYRLEQVGDD